MARDGAGRRPRLRLGALLLVAAVGVLLAVSAWAVTAPQVRYVWPLSMISDLGAGTCFAADGRWICSPRSGEFNGGLVVTGALLAAALGVIGRSWGPWLRSAVLAAALGLLLLAVFPSDAAPRIHLAAAVIALPCASALLLGSGIRGEGLRAARSGARHAAQQAVVGAAPRRRGGPDDGRRAVMPVLRALLAAVSLLATIAHLIPSWRIRGAAELVSLGALLLAVLLEAGVLARASRAGDDPGEAAGVRAAAQPPR